MDYCKFPRLHRTQFFFGTVTDQHDLLNEGGKNKLRMIETTATMFKNSCKEIKTEFIGAKLDSKEKARE